MFDRPLEERALLDPHHLFAGEAFLRGGGMGDDCRPAALGNLFEAAAELFVLRRPIVALGAQLLQESVRCLLRRLARGLRKTLDPEAQLLLLTRPSFALVDETGAGLFELQRKAFAEIVEKSVEALLDARGLGIESAGR